MPISVNGVRPSNGLYLLDKDGAPLRNGILSPDQRAQGEVERARRARPADAVGGTP